MSRGDFLNDFIFVIGLVCVLVTVVIGLWTVIVGAIHVLIGRTEDDRPDADVIQLFDQEQQPA